MFWLNKHLVSQDTTNTSHSFWLHQKHQTRLPKTENLLLLTSVSSFCLIAVKDAEPINFVPTWISLTKGMILTDLHEQLQNIV